MNIIKSAANKNKNDSNCILVSKVMQQVGGGSSVVYVLFVNNKPKDYTASFDRALNWYDVESVKVENAVEVIEIGHFACGNVYVRETR